MNIQNSFSIIWILSTIASLVVGFIWIDDVNAWAGKYTNFINLYLALIGMFVLPVIAWIIKDKIDENKIKLANQLIKTEEARSEYASLSIHDRELFRKNYESISEALSLIMQKGGVNDDAMRLIWQARDQARLELPEDIMMFTENLRAVAQKSWSGRKTCWDSDGNAKGFDGMMQIMNEMHEAEKKLYKIEAYEVYRPHLALTGSSN